MSAEAAQVPWSVRSHGLEVALSVGPVALTAEALEPALELFQLQQEALDAVLPSAAVQRRSVGFSWVTPAASLSPAQLRSVAELAAPVLATMFHGVGVKQVRLSFAGPAVALEVSDPLLPEHIPCVLPLAAGLLRPLVRDVLWESVPTELVRQADGITEEGAAFLVTTRAPSETTLREVRQLWQYARFGELVPYGALEMARRLLPLPAAESVSPVAVTVAVPAPVEAVESSSGVLEIVPFRNGGRPLDELLEPGSGCSEAEVYLSSSGASEIEDRLWTLFKLNPGAGSGPVEVTLSGWFLPRGGGAPVPVPGLVDLPVPARTVGASSDFTPLLVEGRYEPGSVHCYVAEIRPQEQLFPKLRSSGWDWTQLPASFRSMAPDGEDPYTFCQLFHQRVRLQLTARSGSRVIGRSVTEVEVYDTQRFGSLYGRLLELVAKDTQKQGAAMGVRDLYAAYHPWYPVLAIGMNKASFYMKAIHPDLSLQTKQLANPGWLLRVGLYLEFLTCVGIFTAVRDEYPDLMTPAERRWFQESPVFHEIRSRINVEAWKEVWKLRPIVPPSMGVSAGPVGFTNLMQKQKSTLAFLHAHHEDLMHAIELAGPNLDSSQEAWHRVYRDAERAVVNSSMMAFPELRELPTKYRDFSLWHQKGNFQGLVAGGGLVPSWLAAPFGDQDGVYPSGARQYRASMNHIAQRSREKHLMDYVGEECVPKSVSLIEALIAGDEERFASLQARDGYAGTLQAVSQTVRVRGAPGKQAAEALLRGVPLFESLDEAEIAQLAAAARFSACVPEQDVVVQGQPGASLFVVEGGRLDVLLKREDGAPAKVARLLPGAVFGEMALLTGAPRTATVRAVDYAGLFEIAKDAIAPILERRPEVIGQMSELLAARQAESQKIAGQPASRASLVKQIRAYFGAEAKGAPKSTAAPVNEAELQRRREAIATMLRGVKLFQPLVDAELEALAQTVTQTTYAPLERILEQGSRGTSLFVIEQGAVEVLAKGQDAQEQRLARLESGAVFGEMALLTGERRSATVRALEPVSVFEISKADLFPIISRRPPVIVELSEMLATRQTELREKREGGALTEATESASFVRRMRSFFFA